MADFPSVSLKEALSSLGRRPGLLLGPNATYPPGTVTQLIARAVRLAGSDPTGLVDVMESDYRASIEVLVARAPDHAAMITRELRDGFLSLKASSLDLPHLARAGWSACISLTEDLLFESALRNYFDGLPTTRTVTLIDSPRVQPTERTVPVYKLLGSPNAPEDDWGLTLSESALLIRQQSWLSLLRTLPDYLREAPLFVVGTGTAVPLLRVALSALSSMQKPNVGRLLFLKDDVSLKDATVMALCRQYQTAVVDASLREVCAAIAELKPSALVSPIGTSVATASTPVAKVLAKYEGLVSEVPTARPSIDLVRNRHVLIDGLFRPSALDWSPFLVDFELPRTAATAIKGAIRHKLEAPYSPHPGYVVIHGEAGIGKSTLLKRVAVDIARDGTTAIWCRRAFSDGWMRQYRKLASELAEEVKKDPKRQTKIVVFCDDPWGLRLDAGEMLACFENFPGHIVFVFAVRNSAYFTSDGAVQTIGGSSNQEIEVSYELDDLEQQQLAPLLQRIGVVGDEATGKSEIAKLQSRNAKDILCSLWYLVPETRSQLTESLRDEYCRLGDARDTIENVAQYAAVNSQVARRAYECVTVTSHLDIGLPIEVLVRALGVNYEEWLEMTADGRPLWGLLYDEKDEERSTIVYRTRNEVVTGILLDLVNGGVGHVGEVRVLKDLLRACDIGTPAYRGFVIDVLVRARAKLAKYLSFEDGIELYEIATKALPHSDRVVEHHKGIWIDDVGHDYKKAYQQFEVALQSPTFPTADRESPREHIHTSMAATVVRMIKNGEQDRATGYELVKDHLRQAASPTFFNPHTAHVAANLFFELAQQEVGGPPDVVSLSSISGALQEIEKGLQLIGAHGRGQHKHEKNIAMLSDLQRRILRSIPDLGRLKQLANEQYVERSSQVGFEAVARRLLAEAITTDRGRDYNQVNEYLTECIDKIKVKGQQPSSELLLARVDLMIRWRIQRPRGVIDWKTFRDDLRSAQSNPKMRDDVIKQFYLAVAQFHCGDLTDANATFSSLRRLSIPALAPGAIRCYYLGTQGHPRTFQGILERAHQQAYVNIRELDLSVPTRAGASDGVAGATVHAYLGFAINGPVGVFAKPDETDGLLP